MFESVMSMPTLLAVTGLALAAIEIAVFGFGTIFLIFLSIGFLVSSLLMFFGVIPESIFAAAGSVGISSLIAAVVLWKPMRDLQANHQSPQDQPNVFKGLTFHIGEELAKGNTISHKYSGIEWKLILEGEQEVLAAGTEVEVVKTAVGKMHVKPV
ncbi:hypothetical protein TDB9533_01732 [Thalassocella blandensis]|nr:hypothetical protein TDB9533_01732 [Thalassocella blandensis]